MAANSMVLWRCRLWEDMFCARSSFQPATHNRSISTTLTCCAVHRKRTTSNDTTPNARQMVPIQTQVDGCCYQDTAAIARMHALWSPRRHGHVQGPHVGSGPVGMILESPLFVI